MGLRLKEGISLDRYSEISGTTVSSDALQHLNEIGMISVANGRLIVTNQGVMVLNAVIEALLPD